MDELSLRTMQLSELKDCYQHIRRDFPVGEYPPYEILFRQMEDGCQQGFILHDQQRQLGYAICAPSRDYVLISLLAVLPPWRKQGYGSRFLLSLRCLYQLRQGMIAEVERPELALDANQTRTRRARIDFYRRAGFILLEGIDYSIWDVPMYLMVCPLQTEWEDIARDIESIIYEIYFQLMGAQYMHKLVLTKVSPGSDDLD